MTIKFDIHCTLENASELISGVVFEIHHEIGVIARAVEEGVAAIFRDIPGYNVTECKPAKAAPASKPAKVEAPAPAAPAAPVVVEAAPVVEAPAEPAPAEAQTPESEAPAVVAEAPAEDPAAAAIAAALAAAGA